MKTIDISQLVLVTGGAGGDRSDLFRRRIEGGLIANTGHAGSVQVNGGSFSGSTGSARVSVDGISGTCKASVVKDTGEIGAISCKPLALQNLVRH